MALNNADCEGSSACAKEQRCVVRYGACVTSDEADRAANELRERARPD